MAETKEPSWRLTVAGVVTVITITIAGWSEVSGKTDKKETADLKKEIVQLDKGQALSAKDIATIAKGVDELKDMMKEVSRGQNMILQALMEKKESREYGPPSPNPLNR